MMQGNPNQQAIMQALMQAQQRGMQPMQRRPGMNGQMMGTPPGVQALMQPGGTAPRPVRM